MIAEHIPVLLKEAVEGLQVQEGEKYIDCTVGFGGHTLEIVKQGGIVLGVDRDPETIQRLKDSRIQGFKDQIQIRQGNFKDIKEIAKEASFNQVSGILFDLGYSSWQLDKSGRGFTYTKDEPLDMRFDPKTQEIRAQDILNKMPAEELIEIITTYGEEEHGKKIGEAIVRTRPIETTGQLLALLDTVLSVPGRQRHAARIFQALRIAVNNELGALKKALPEAVELLRPRGRMAVISFHSLEDRIVKNFLKDQENKTLTIVTKKPIIAGWPEIRQNSRSRSAKLRIAEKL